MKTPKVRKHCGSCKREVMMHPNHDLCLRCYRKEQEAQAYRDGFIAGRAAALRKMGGTP